MTTLQMFPSFRALQAWLQVSKRTIVESGFTISFTQLKITSPNGDVVQLGYGNCVTPYLSYRFDKVVGTTNPKFKRLAHW